jgi:hypothetical protein
MPAANCVKPAAVVSVGVFDLMSSSIISPAVRGVPVTENVDRGKENAIANPRVTGVVIDFKCDSRFLSA